MSENDGKFEMDLPEEIKDALHEQQEEMKQEVEEEKVVYVPAKKFKIKAEYEKQDEQPVVVIPADSSDLVIIGVGNPMYDKMLAQCEKEGFPPRFDWLNKTYVTYQNYFTHVWNFRLEE